MHLMDTLSAWSRALRDPSLRDLPYKIETNEYGQLVMSPQKPKHGHLQFRVANLLDDLMDRPGRASVEFAVETPKGVKVPDAVWVSEERWNAMGADAEASTVAAEICVEVLSRSNTKAEIDEKRGLYFERGAVEVWTCDMDGRIRFFHRDGERPASALVPAFPSVIEV